MSQLTAFVGTYTNGESKGIYRFTFDPTSGNIELPELAAEIEAPTYLTISPNNEHLYAVAKNVQGGGVAAFSISENHSLDYLNGLVEEGANPCHVSLHSKSGLLLSANYHKGQVDAYTLTPDGALSEHSSSVKHTGSGPIEERQEKAHAHFAGVTPDGQFIVSADLGADSLYVYDVTENELKLKEEIKVKPGTGPRHITFHPNGKFAYVNGELSSEILVFEYHYGTFTLIQTISTLPEDFLGDNTGGAIQITSDGHYIYASNRGHDSIYIFKVKESGELDFSSAVTSGGEHPRDFTLDPTEKYVFVANKDSDNVVLYTRDTESGALTKTEKEISIPNPVCLKFLHY
ncbi:lactonase family protein [Alkalihalobacillus trypoxylicola]|uniref:6-phosphogluconolactonase n=1 Tax=Alkalihalobacillus trypoxylicola TaxID=519424 RepID=A0A162FCL1_9BACI|nr:lactonase family protein [Alkalihalobacillus trypoxylicola]KYG35298.1 6-phosphogluconolactonase [Alkalihalobacillus trypoxylicola]